MKSVLKSIVVAILEWETRLVLKKYKPKIVAVTGSVGKTSSKDAIYTVLSHFFYTRKSEKSYNGEIGIPLTVLGCPNAWNSTRGWIRNIFEGLLLILLPNRYPDWLVIEVGADRPGDIKHMAELIKPDIAVVTRLSKVPVHVEYFGSPEELYTEKGYLVKALKPGGTLILNSDDEDVMLFKELTAEAIMLYGLQEPATVSARDISLEYDEVKVKTPKGISAVVTHANDEVKVVLEGSVGKQYIYSVLAACAVGVVLDLDMTGMAHAFRDFEPPKGRMRLIPGIKETTIIDDTYNSSPIALEEALRTIDDMKVVGKKIAVLGDMLELGTYTAEEHKKAGERAAKTVDILFTVGVRARGIAEGALQAGMPESVVFQYEESKTAGKDLELQLKKGDVVLVKGSQGVRMERAVEEVMVEPQHKERLLVRQDPEWQIR